MLKVGKCKLSDLLSSLDITQQELAEKLQISKSLISEYVNNKHTMSYERAKNIADELGVAMDDLYDWVADD